MSLVQVLSIAGAVYLPAVVLHPEVAAGRTDRLIWAGTTALAALVFLSVAAGQIHLDLIFVVWAAAAAGAAARLAARRRAPRELSASGGGDGVDWWLAAILILVGVSRLIVASAHELPPGWDPTFHLVLARKIADARAMIHDWTPFEDVALNYPLGSHFLVAIVSRAARVDLHTTFNLLVPLIGVLTTAQMYLLAKHATASAEIGRYTAVAYGFWANWGSLDYYRWGGLPNLAGMSLLIGALTLLVQPAFGWRQRTLLGLLFAAIAVTHHHVTLTAGVLMAALFATFLWRRDTPRARGLAWGLAIAAALASFHLVPYALKAGLIGETSVLTETEPRIPADRLVQSIGGVLLAVGSAGVAAAALGRSPHRPSAVVGVVTAVLSVLFVALHYVYPTLSLELTGDELIPFTPSRFLTDSIYFLTIFAGYAVYRMRTASRLPVSGALAGMLLAGLTMLPVWRHLYAIAALDPATWEAYSVIQAHTAPDAIVLDRGRWSAYGTWRRTAYTSLPVSEPSTAGTAKAELIEALQAAAPDGMPGAERPAEAGSTQIVTLRREPGAPDRERVLWRHPSGLAVVELWPAR